MQMNDKYVSASSVKSSREQGESANQARDEKEARESYRSMAPCSISNLPSRQKLKKSMSRLPTLLEKPHIIEGTEQQLADFQARK